MSPATPGTVSLADGAGGTASVGAAAVSVLTEPTEFKGELAHLVDAAQLLAPFGRPAMRKDFLVDPYQVLEARACGAGGVLVIVTMLDDATVKALVDTARAELTYHRVPYEVGEAAKKIRRAGLPEMYAERLAWGQ